MNTQQEELPEIFPRKTLDEFSYQVAYDLSNDWMKENPTWEDVETAVKLGAKWKEKQMMKDAIVDGICISNGTECGASIESSVGMLFFKHNTLNVGDKVKIIIIKEE